MTFRITKGDLTIETDSEREAARVLAWFDPPTGWYSVADVAPTPPEPQVVLVRPVLLDVLKVLLKVYNPGITAKGISELTGVKQSTVSHRLTRLNKMGLAESMLLLPMHWRATDLARRAKLVAS